MKAGMRAAAIFALWLQASVVCATTWTDVNVDDPVAGGKCKVREPASFGSYIYEWPDKYDQVFWPSTAADGIWICTQSGFAAFIGDMQLKPEEKTRVAEYLKANPLRESAALGTAEKLERLQAVYALRDLEPAHRSSVTRSMAYQYESIGDQDRANGLRRSALADMKRTLQDGALPGDLRLQYLFVAANYAREFADTAESDRLLAELETAILAAAADPELKNYADYLKTQLPQARKIAPGGKLAP